MTIRKYEAFQPQLLAVAVALGVSAQAQAIDFNIGEIQGQFDSSLSIGASWAAADPDPKFVSNFNSVGANGNSSARNADDGRLNFKKGETFSKIFKGVHDLELKYGDSGAFVRGKYWYDFELMDEHQSFYDIDDHGRDRAAKSSGAMFLDSFIYHNYTIDDLAGNVRLGKQVVSWGESTFISNGINAINPVDVTALRRPGAEVKEGLIPVNLLYVSQSLSENFNAEAFYQLEWKKSVVDNCGTFFSVDPIAKGCTDRNVLAGLDLAPGVASNTATIPQINAGALDDVYLPRAKDKDARDGGQYGLALRWNVPELNDTEFGAYALNYHSRSPSVSFTQNTSTVPGLAQQVRATRYFVEYPEDIRLYGLSFATNYEGVALGGEVSYRPNQPLSINGADLNYAATGVSPLTPVFTSGFASKSAGAYLPGYKRMPVTQAQLTATRFFNQVLGGERLTLIGEVGYTHISGLGATDGTDLRFGRSTTFGPGILPGAAGAATCAGSPTQVPGAPAGTTRPSNPQQECNNKGFYSTSSWGYRTRASLNYPNAIAGVNLTPNVAWSHDVNGRSPTFEEGAKAISVGLDADYQSTYTASLNYTNFFGGDFNTQTDRDFLSLSFGVNF
jgi:hypothetical protein